MARELELEIVIQADRAKQELRDTQTALDNITRSAVKTGTATEDLNKAYVTLTQKSERLKTEIKGYDTQLKTATDQTVKATAAAKAHDTAITKQTQSTGLLSSAIVRYASGAAVLAAIKSTADWADRLDELSVQTGLSITSLQKLDKIAKLNGSTAEQLAQSFSLVQDRIAGGDKSAVRAFDKLGLSIEAFKKLNPEQQMLQLADAVTRVEDPSQRANVAIDLFGKSGARLIPVLDQISKGYDDITVATEENVKAVGQLSDWWETIKGTGAEVIVGVLGPMIKTLKEGTFQQGTWTDTIGAWAETLSNVAGPAAASYVRTLREWASVTNAIELPPLPGAPGLSNNGMSSLPEFNLKNIRQWESDINDQIREQARLHTERAKAAEESSRRVVAAAAAELSAFNSILATNRGIVATQQAAVGQSMFWGTWNQDTRLKANQLPGNWGMGMSYYTMGATGQNVTGPGGLMSPGPGGGFFLNNAQSQWRQSNFSRDNLANTAMGYADQLAEISESGDPIWNATNVRGRGNRAAKGALKGGEVGGRYGGPYGAAGGAVIGALVGAFRNPMFEDIANRVRANYGGAELTDEAAKAIEDRTRKEFGGDRQAAEIASLGLIRSQNPLTDKNFGAMTSRFRDAFSMKETGKFSQEQLSGVVEENFGAYADYIVKSGKLASDQFVELIKLAKEFGVESGAVKEFVGGQTSVIGSGLATMLSPILDEAVKIGGAVREAQADVDALAAAGKTGSTEYADALARLNVLQAQQGVEAKLVAGDLDNIGVVALAAFNKARESGLSFGEAIDAIGPSLDALIVAQEGYGITSENAAVQQLVRYRELADANRPLIDAAGALNETMLALSSIGALNADTLAAMEDQGMRTYNRLIDAGFTENESLAQMGDWLGTVKESHERLGIPIDENTQKLIDQATQQGILKDKALDTNSILIDGLAAIIKAVGGDLPAAWTKSADVAKEQSERAAREAQTAFDGIEVTIPVNYETREGYQPGNAGGGSPDGAAGGGYVTSRGIRYLSGGGVLMPVNWRARGSDTVPAMLTPGEGVLSRKGMAMLGALNRGEGGGNTFHITISADSREGGQAAAQGFMEELRRRGVKLSAA